MPESIANYYKANYPNKRIHMMIRDLERLRLIGEVKWIAINLIDFEPYTDEFRIEFTNMRQLGFFEGDRIFISYTTDWIARTYNIILLILEIVQDPNCIDSITTEMELELNNKIVDLSVEINGKNPFPSIIEISDPILHFDIINYIQIKWNKTILEI